MKKLFVLLLAVLLCIPVCFPAFADMAGPEFNTYKAKVNTDIPYYDWEMDEDIKENVFRKAGTIPAGITLEIAGEYNVNGEMYGLFYHIRKDDDTVGYVLLKDIQTNNSGAYPAVTGYKQSEPVRLRVTDPNGIVLYSGPSATYPRVGVIAQGTELTVDTLDQGDYTYGAWMYIQHGGKSGWTNCWLFDGDECPMAELLPEGKTGTVWVVKDNAVFRDTASNDLIAVPKGEKLTFDSINRSPHTLYYHVTYQGKTGCFSVDDDGFDNVVASNINGNIIYTTPPVIRNYTAALYAYPDDKLPIGTVRYQAGDKLESEFLYYAEPGEYRGGIQWNYVEKDGKSGWIKTDFEKLEMPEDYTIYPVDIQNLLSENAGQKVTVTVEQSATGSETVSAQHESSPANALHTPTAETDAVEADNPNTVPEQSDGTTEPAFSARFETTEPSSEEVVPVSSGRTLSPTGYIGVCVAAAAVLALTAFITLRLIRRKKSD